MSRAASTCLDDLRAGVIRLRTYMMTLNELLKSQRYKVPIHLALGQECVPVVLRNLLTDQDQLYLTHRNVGYNLCWSSGLDEILEYYSLLHDDERLHMGSMNLTLPGSPIRYASSILGNNLPVAAGGALSMKLREGRGVAFVVAGDGAIEEGAFYETLVFASSHNLPLVVVVENNDHSMTSRIADRRCGIDLLSLAGSMGVAFQSADGVAVDAVHDRLAEARARALKGEPVLVEVAVPIYNQHAGPTPGFPDDPMDVDLSAGLVLGDATTDPVARIREMAPIAFAALEAELLRELQDLQLVW